jgi:hypothetical protein
MTNLNIARTRDRLQRFEFGPLFIEELGWSQPKMHQTIRVALDDKKFEHREIAELGGIAVFEVKAAAGDIPDAKIRAALDKEISKYVHENLLIFVDQVRTQSLWYWVKRANNKRYPRDHYYFRGQPGDSFLGKLSAMFFDIGDLDESGNVSVVEVAQRLQKALDIERITKKFYSEYQDEHLAFTELIEGINDERDRRWYASVLLNRLMFIYFLQRKLFLDRGNTDYLHTKLEASKRRGKDRYYRDFLVALFFEGFAKPEDQRSAAANAALGQIKYLNGGLFIPHKIEEKWKNIRVPDAAFENLLALFERYSWNLNDTPGGQDDEINPDVLGYIFEKYINQKAFGAYYTRPEITEYLCEQTIHRLILDKVNRPGIPGVVEARQFTSMADLLLHLDAALCRELLFDILPKLSLLDPACGSGAFLIAALKVLIAIYTAIAGKIEFLNDRHLADWLDKAKTEHRSLGYYLKKRIITDNLFGVDIMEEAVEIARLRLFLALVGSVQSVDQLEPLPNIDFNILVGNSLIGLLRVNEKTYDAKHQQTNMFQKSYYEIVAEKERLIRSYRDAASYAEDLRVLRDQIDEHRAAATEELHDILLDEFKGLGIQYEEYAWDAKKGEVSKKRAVRIKDMRVLHPFHWGYEFPEIMNQRGGFDGIITNPPWEVFQTNEKEFFQQFAPTIQKKALRIEDWEQQRVELLDDPEIRRAWLEYASRFPHQWIYFKKATQYANQTSLVNGKAVGNKPNLYCLFTEQCFNLLRNGGYAGVVIPSGIYTDLGAKQLREMLFTNAQIQTLFCIENREGVFEDVHRSFKFVVLAFEKGGATSSFAAAFMRHDVNELRHFPAEGAVQVPVDLVRQLSPDSLSVPEFKDRDDVQLTRKFSDAPLLADPQKGWGLELYGEELNMTRSSGFFKTTPTEYPLFEGGMIWHFDHRFGEARYWVKESELRKVFLEKRVKRIESLDRLPRDMRNDYEVYRLAVRKIASNTNERTLITTVIPPHSFAGNSLSVNFPFRHNKDSYNELRLTYKELLAVSALLNSFVADYILRARMTTNLNLFYLYQLPIPRLTEKDKAFAPIVERAAKLICTTPEFDNLAKDVGLRSRRDGVTDAKQRAGLRAELDGMIAHLYGLTENEFAHILATFPLVDQSVKDATLEAYRKYSK